MAISRKSSLTLATRQRSKRERPRDRDRTPAPVEILQVRIGAGEREIDIVEDAGVAGAGLAGSARHEPLDERRNRRGVVAVEECAELCASLVRMVGAGAAPFFLFFGRSSLA